MWFIVLIAYVHGFEVPNLTETVAGNRFPDQTVCIDSAAQRASALQRIGMHGDFACMYHGEPDREVAHAPKWSF